MIKVRIEYKCGCKFRTEEQEKAIEHSVLTGHTLDVVGIIRNDELKKGGGK